MLMTCGEFILVKYITYNELNLRELCVTLSRMYLSMFVLLVIHVCGVYFKYLIYIYIMCVYYIMCTV